MARQLSVYFDAQHAGTLLQDDSGRLHFRYDPAYVKAGNMPLSISMPLSGKEYEDNHARPFFSNLLPENPCLLSNLSISKGWARLSMAKSKRLLRKGRSMF